MAGRGSSAWALIVLGVCTGGCTRSGYHLGDAGRGAKDAEVRDRPAVDDLRHEEQARDQRRLDAKHDTARDKSLAVDLRPAPDLPSRFDRGLNPNGTYNVAPKIAYQCAFGVVNFSIDVMTFSDTGTSLTITTGPTGPKGGCGVLVGDTAFDGPFLATCTYAGNCTEVYTLSGSFVDASHWTGTYTAKYSGTCVNCADQSVPVSGARK